MFSFNIQSAYLMFSFNLRSAYLLYVVGDVRSLRGRARRWICDVPALLGLPHPAIRKTRHYVQRRTNNPAFDGLPLRSSLVAFARTERGVVSCETGQHW